MFTSVVTSSVEFLTPSNVNCGCKKHQNRYLGKIKHTTLDVKSIRIVILERLSIQCFFPYSEKFKKKCRNDEAPSKQASFQGSRELAFQSWASMCTFICMSACLCVLMSIHGLPVINLTVSETISTNIYFYCFLKNQSETKPINNPLFST